MDLLLFMILCTMIYFTPYIIATSRNHKNTPAIFILNAVLGWTVLGWLVALVWSATNNVK